MTAEDRFLLEARAGRHREAQRLALTWSQGTMWDYTLALGTDAQVLNLRHHRPLRSPRSIEQVVAAITDFVASYDVARTTFDMTQRVQVISEAVTVPIHVRETAGDLPEAGPALAADLAEKAFSVTSELPIRFGLVVDGDQVRSIATVFSHLVFDAAGRVVASALLDGCLDGIAQEVPQPGDLVRREALGPLRDRGDATLRQWWSTLSALTPGRGLRLTVAGSFTEWVLQSRAVAVAAQTISVRTRVSTSSVILAALAAAVRSALPDAPEVMLLIASNRHHPDLSEFPGIAFQNALHVIPAEDPEKDADSYIRHTEVSAMRAYAKARYDSQRMRAVLGDMTIRGEAPDVSFYFNDTRASRSWDGLENQTEALRAWRADDVSVTAVGNHRMRDATLFAYLLSRDATARMHMVCDDSVIPAPKAAEILQGLEGYLVRQALAD